MADDNRHEFIPGRIAATAKDEYDALAALRDAKVARATKTASRTVASAKSAEMARILRENPMMSGGKAFTDAQRAAALKKGMFRNRWVQAAGNRASVVKPAMKAVIDGSNPVVKSAIATGEAGVKAAQSMAGSGPVKRAVLAVGDRMKKVAESKAFAETGKVLTRLGVNTAFASSLGRKLIETGKPAASIFSKRGVYNGLIHLGGKLPSVGLEAVESLGKHVFSARGIGKLGRSLTSAKGNAAAFAIGSWIDAGLEMYDYFKEGGSRDVNGPAKLIGKGSVFADKNFWSSYGSNVGKKLANAVTLGFFGNDDDAVGKWFDRVVGGELTEDQAAARAAAEMENVRMGKNPDGTAREDGEKIRKMYEQIDLDKMRRGAATFDFAVPGGKLSPQENFRRHLSNLVAEKAERVNSHDLYRGKEMTDAQRKRVGERYDGYIKAALANPLAQKWSEDNRAKFYSLVTGGRSYDTDYKLSGKDPNAVKGFGQFNERWNGQDLQTQVMYDHEAAVKRFNAARMKRMEDIQNADNGSN